jgi:plasmid maintenance system antidote protein VapI
MTTKQKKALVGENSVRQRKSEISATAGENSVRRSKTKAHETEIVDGLTFREGVDVRRPEISILIDYESLKDFGIALKEAYEDLASLAPQTALSPAERRLLNSIRSRRLGFIVRSAEMASAHLNYTPRDWSDPLMNRFTTQTTMLDELISITDQIRTILTDRFIVSADEAYRLARLFYRSVQMWANTGDQGALAVYDRLNEFFRHRRLTESESGVVIGPGTPGVERPQPTKKQLKKDFNALVKGTKDGTLTIEHHSAHLVGGEREIIDTTHKPEVNYGVVEALIECPQCHEPLPNHAKFCLNCGLNLTENKK